jgi:hypothetical protein
MNPQVLVNLWRPPAMHGEEEGRRACLKFGGGLVGNVSQYWFIICETNYAAVTDGLNAFGQ